MSKRGFVTACAVAGLIGAGMAFGAALASAEGGATPSVFVPITPCRLTDTRAGSTVGPVNAPVAAQATMTVQVEGVNGNCAIPVLATGIATNVTIANPSANSYLTVWPADVERPLSSNLNWVAQGAPTPNQVTVGLSADGKVSVFNNAGTVDVIIDIVGYYEPGSGGEPGPAGPIGPNGSPGDPGPRGFSAWDAIPAGVTVTGTAYLDDEAAAAGDDFGFSVDIPGTPPSPLTGAVFLGADAKASALQVSAECTGTFNAPTAPKGKMCWYLGAKVNVADLSVAVLGLGQRASRIRATAAAAGDILIFASWAYTAPDA